MANGIIQIDPRVGSRELLKHFTKGRACISASELSADFQFLGYGPDGICSIGIERKRTSEFISDYDRFAANQLVPLLNSYRFRFLVIEGAYQPTPDAHVALWERDHWSNRAHDGRTPTFKTMWGRQITLMLRTYCLVIPTVSEIHTALAIEGMYNWFQRPWHEHESYNVKYINPPPVALPRVPSVMQNMLMGLSDPEKKEKGIGWASAVALSEKYNTMEELVNASTAEIADVRIGKSQRRLGEQAAKFLKRYVGGVK
jgi:ERCC4-type nuclease